MFGKKLFVRIAARTPKARAVALRSVSLPTLRSAHRKDTGLRGERVAPAVGRPSLYMAMCSKCVPSAWHSGA